MLAIAINIPANHAVKKHGAPHSAKKLMVELIADVVKFPKGRIDSLTNHLVKKCPALPLHDRRRVLLQFHELPLPDSMPHAARANTSLSQMPNEQKAHQSFVPAKQLSALETLAEVSRRHLDLSGKRMPDKQPTQGDTGANHMALLEDFLMNDDRPEAADLVALSHGLDIPNTPALSTDYQFNDPLSHTPTVSPHIGHMSLPTASPIVQMAPSLVMAASAANELMPLTNGLTMDSDLALSGTGINSLADKFFHSQDRSTWSDLQTNSLDPLLQNSNKDQLMSKDDQFSKSAHLRPIAMSTGTQTHFATGFTVNEKPVKPRVRGRFSDSRRKEVQEVRKRGACIRCRMLKKPCSGNTPCSTCQNVDSARLWKQPCTRTRIAEDFDLYSAGLHSVLSYHAINQAKCQVRLDRVIGRLEATHFLDSATFATFAPLRCQQKLCINDASINSSIFGLPNTPDLDLIDGDEDISGKLDQYVRKMDAFFFESERSAFMKVTLNAASMASSAQDEFLSKTVELWNLTRILTSQNLRWYIFSNPSLVPTMTPAAMSSSELENISRRIITSADHSPSYNLIRMQLQGAVEKRAACLARMVMNDLERRLLQRQQANPFETFLMAVILLACVERMSWLFHTWEIPRSGTKESDVQTSHQFSSTETNLASVLRPIPPKSASNHDVAFQASRNHGWPLDQPPAAFSQQGERFSDILNMLLKMRGVPPKPIPRNSDGMLVIWDDEVNEKVRNWYDGIAVTTHLLDEKAKAQCVGLEPSEWELKYVGKIIRGD